ncbi:General substrate transporter [Niveomyces insectorum RCEF 264]|uniref:General substrate transporter n=1 Tax=Niveomyces insectorum RCEF 264 TaxID=1081102 RepID=A0A167PY90_9HYPO|nr:General substrate transporter [Niveomyces insectorum RCEF 264]
MPYFGLRGQRLNRATILLVTLPSFMAYGYNQSVAGGLLTLKAFANQFPQMDTIFTTGSEQAYNAKIQGTVIALYTVGGMFGAILTSYLGDILGRRKSIFLFSLINVLGAVLMASSFSFAQFIVARIVIGLGTGAISGTVPVWQSELSKSNNRGAHVATVGVFQSAAGAIGFWIDFAFYFVKDSSVSWRFPLAFQLLWTLMAIAFIYTLPESPQWLIKRGRIQEAREIMAILSDTSPDAASIDEDIKNVQTSLQIAESGTVKDFFTMGKYRIMHRATLAVLGLFFSQICGINIITFYATTIFEQYLNMSPVKGRLLSACMECMQPIGAIFAIYTIDRYGRRPLMLITAVGMAISMAILAGCTANVNNTAALIVAIIFLFVVNFMYCVGFLGCQFLYSSEISPLHVRSVVNGMAVGATWGTNFMVAEVTPSGFNNIKWGYYLVWAAINAIIIPIIYFFFPETAGRSLEEIDEIFAQSKSIFDVVGIAKTMPFKNAMAREAGVFDKETGIMDVPSSVSHHESSARGVDEKVENAASGVVKNE